MSFKHFVYIDESGSGSPDQTDTNRMWVSAAICVSFDDKKLLDDGIEEILKENLRQRAKELKGSDIRKNLLNGKTLEDVTSTFHELVSEMNVQIWVAGTHGGADPPPFFSIETKHAKEIARQLLLAEINEYLNVGNLKPDYALLIWDLSDHTELKDFSKNVAAFRDRVRGTTINPRLAPAILGGLSHDWSGLQAADLIVHLAFHKIAVEENIPGGNIDKATAFTKHIYPHLQRDPEGNVVGWQKWGKAWQ